MIIPICLYNSQGYQEFQSVAKAIKQASAKHMLPVNFRSTWSFKRSTDEHLSCPCKVKCSKQTQMQLMKRHVTLHG